MGTISGSGAGAGNTAVTFSDTGGGAFYYTAGYNGNGIVQNSFAGNVVVAAGRVAQLEKAVDALVRGVRIALVAGERALDQLVWCL